MLTSKTSFSCKIKKKKALPVKEMEHISQFLHDFVKETFKMPKLIFMIYHLPLKSIYWIVEHGEIDIFAKDPLRFTRFII